MVLKLLLTIMVVNGMDLPDNNAHSDADAGCAGGLRKNVKAMKDAGLSILGNMKNAAARALRRPRPDSPTSYEPLLRNEPYTEDRERILTESKRLARCVLDRALSKAQERETNLWSRAADGDDNDICTYGSVASMSNEAPTYVNVAAPTDATPTEAAPTHCPPLGVWWGRFGVNRRGPASNSPTAKERAKECAKWSNWDWCPEGKDDKRRRESPRGLGRIRTLADDGETWIEGRLSDPTPVLRRGSDECSTTPTSGSGASTASGSGDESAPPRSSSDEDPQAPSSASSNEASVRPDTPAAEPVTEDKPKEVDYFEHMPQDKINEIMTRARHEARFAKEAESVRLRARAALEYSADDHIARLAEMPTWQIKHVLANQASARLRFCSRFCSDTYFRDHVPSNTYFWEAMQRLHDAEMKALASDDVVAAAEEQPQHPLTIPATQPTDAAPEASMINELGDWNYEESFSADDHADQMQAEQEADQDQSTANDGRRTQWQEAGTNRWVRRSDASH